MALAAYRELLRSSRIAFQGDITLLVASRCQARAAFEKNSLLSPTSPECKLAITEARDVSRILRENVVQGRKVDVSCEKEMATYSFARCSELRINKYTERGDNNTIKLCGQKKKTPLDNPLSPE